MADNYRANNIMADIFKCPKNMQFEINLPRPPFLYFVYYSLRSLYFSQQTILMWTGSCTINIDYTD